ncbi:SGNH/GDSL hydrolase family protein [Paenibacillus silviterrae]|uniref:SGNH/GDSL hydrolase family protein n=1 Tax=Paenibacillus silviterrae TaxID=3242194 RepID=UPI0025429271|nr:SGNH/GDSL hydrolase family protein [Paenibacillus chinjuensis]
MADLKRWQGKSWGTLGDSITEANGYQPIVAARLGFTRVENYGKSGCPMTAGGERDYGATVNIAPSTDPFLDCVTILAGINDFRLNKPIGSIDCRSVETFYGAYRATIETILTRNPITRLSLWTPMQRDKDGYDNESINAAGHRLRDYVSVIRTLGEEYALPVLDLYALSGFNKWTLSYFTSDRLHPNQAGHERIADLASAFLAQI